MAPAVPARRAFTLLETIAVIVVIGILAAIVFASTSALLERQRTDILDATLRAVDADAIGLADANGQVDPRPWLDDAATAVELPQREVDEDTLRVRVDEAAGTVTITRYGVCRQLTASPTADPGSIGDC